MSKKNDAREGKGPVTRRDFIKSAARAGAAASAAGMAGQAFAQAKPEQYEYKKSILPPEIVGANDKIYTGHIGVGGMGRSNLVFALKRNDMRPIALCDLWWKNTQRAEQMAGQKFKELTTHHDYREVIDNKDVDAVIIATPDHWHCIPTLAAADAGKAIYCEKPCATTIYEGRAMVEKVKQTGVVFQAGNFHRSMAHFKEAVELVRSGYIGKVGKIDTYIHDDEPKTGIGMGDDDISKFDGIDWVTHQGWVEHKPFNTNRWIYNFRWFLDYSGGKITDWGAHLMDIGLWAMGDTEKVVKSVTASGGKYVVEDNRTTPDTLDVVWEFDDCTMSFSNRVYNQFLPPGFQSHGILFHGTLGTLYAHRGGYEVFPVQNNGGCEPKKAVAEVLNEPHWENFAKAVRGEEKPNSPVEVIHNTTTLCHMGTTSYVVGEKLGWDAATERFTSSADEIAKKANDWAYRPYNNGYSIEKPYHSA